MRKTLLVLGLGATVMAGVLDTNDVKLNTTLGLGGNPAAIAVNKETKIEGGTIAKNDLTQSGQ
ncbi:hypothetical protein NO2_1375, partial [Candidatus Termititenax persephonae]